MKIAIAQISPVWLEKIATINKVCDCISDAAAKGCELIVFGETILPGYPFWVAYTEGALFNSEIQKELHASYLKAAITIENGDLEKVTTLAKQHKINIYIGIAERPSDRGRHSVYCSLVFIDIHGTIQSVHRKLQPTYEERLVWAMGDGNGLKTHAINDFQIGGLNCWENWMPLSRVALYAQGENIHVGVWPGSERNTKDITRYIAEESRSYSIAVSGLFKTSDIPKSMPHYDLLIEKCPPIMANGGSCVANPDGSWLIEPILDKEGIFVAELSYDIILQERQNFDLAGHYSRPDVTRLVLNTERQSLIEKTNGKTD